MKGIIFSGTSVKQILAGQKWQTRRVIKFPPHTYTPDAGWVKSVHQDGSGNWVAWSTDEIGLEYFTKRAYSDGGFPCPYGKPGDELYAKETWGYGRLGIAQAGPFARNQFFYKAHMEGANVASDFWRSPYFMPEKASRLKIKLTGVRAEKLQDISEDDVCAEGIEACLDCDDYGLLHRNDESHWNVSDYRREWDKINGKKHPWSSNPWVWVLEFKKA